MFWILVSQRNEVSSHQVFEESLKWNLTLLRVQHTVAWQFLRSIGSFLCQVRFVEGEKVSWELTAASQKHFNVQKSYELSHVQAWYEVDITGQSSAARGCTQDALCLNRRSFGIGNMVQKKGFVDALRGMKTVVRAFQLLFGSWKIADGWTIHIESKLALFWIQTFQIFILCLVWKIVFSSR